MNHERFRHHGEISWIGPVSRLARRGRGFLGRAVWVRTWLLWTRHLLGGAESASSLVNRRTLIGNHELLRARRVFSVLLGGVTVRALRCTQGTHRGYRCDGYRIGFPYAGRPALAGICGIRADVG